MLMTAVCQELPRVIESLVEKNNVDSWSQLGLLLDINSARIAG